MLDPGPTVEGREGRLNPRTETIPVAERLRLLPGATPGHLDLLFVVGEPVSFPPRLDRTFFPSRASEAMLNRKDHVAMIPGGDVLNRGVSHRAPLDPAFFGQCELRQVRRLALLLPARNRSDNFRSHRGGRGHVLLAAVERIRT